MRMRLLSATNTPFNLPLTRKTDKTTVTFVTYSTRGGVLKLCTMPMTWIDKCVCVVLVVNIMIHSYILVWVLCYLVTCSCILIRHVQGTCTSTILQNNVAEILIVYVRT